MKLKTLLFSIFMMMTIVAFSQTYNNMNNRREKQYNSDGTVTYTEYSNCWLCKGNKQCNMCKGQGGMMTGYGAYARYNVCPRCHGDGKCHSCHGTGGKIVSSYTTLPDDKFNNGNYIRHYKGYSKVVRNKNFVTRTAYTQCTRCRGTNICYYCQGQGGKNFGGYYSPHYITCNICNGGGSCNSCDYRGMVKVVTTIDFDTGTTTYHNKSTGYCSAGYIDLNSTLCDYNSDFNVLVDERKSRGKLTPEQYREHYAKWENQARSCYESLVDIVKTNGGDELHVNKHKADESIFYQSGMMELLIRSQAEMRNVRSEAASYGVTIMKSRWETCSPPSRY